MPAADGSKTRRGTSLRSTSLTSFGESIEEGKLTGLIEVLRQDPRRAGSKRDPSRVYHLAYSSLDVAFTVDGDVLHVVCVS